MASRITQLDVWNQALGHAKSGGDVSDLNEASAEAAACRTYWETVVRRVQESAHWPVCRAYISPPLLGEASDDEQFRVGDPPPGFAFAYGFPDDGLLPWEMVSTLPFDFGVYSRADAPDALAVFSNEEEPVLKYGRFQENTAFWTGHMVEVTSLALGVRLAQRLTGDKVLARQLIAEAQNALNSARASSSTTQNARHFVPDFHAARGYTDIGPTTRFVYQVGNLFGNAVGGGVPSGVGAPTAQSPRSNR